MKNISLIILIKVLTDVFVAFKKIYIDRVHKSSFHTNIYVEICPY